MAISEIYIGLLSGTSIDAIDVAVFSISATAEQPSIQLNSSLSYKIPLDLKNKLNKLIINSQSVNLQELGSINRELGNIFAEAVQAILVQNNLKPSAITAIGFHGQTVFHHPVMPLNFTMQLGDANTIREITQIPVITDFRQRDMINGGQGAPLAPIFHQAFFHSSKSSRAVVNIGGIANITLLAKNNDLKNIASDLGPGNTLLDLYYVLNNPDSFAYDRDGDYAKKGRLNHDLLQSLLNDPYFSKPWPKSTGREYFNLAWLNTHLKNFAKLPSEDIQRTLLELTVQLIAKNIPVDFNEVYLCGGGAFNTFLVTRLKELLPTMLVTTTSQIGVSEEWVEAGLFAWLAYCNVHGIKLNLSNITGNSRQQSTLGCIYN